MNSELEKRLAQLRGERTRAVAQTGDEMRALKDDLAQECAAISAQMKQNAQHVLSRVEATGKAVRALKVDLDGVEANAKNAKAHLVDLDLALAQLKQKVRRVLTIALFATLLILLIAAGIGLNIVHNARNEASELRSSNASEMRRIREQHHRMMEELENEFVERARRIEDDIDLSAEALAHLRNDRDRIEREMQGFLELQQRVGFQLIEYRNRALLVVPDGHELRSWGAPGLSNLARYNGRMYRVVERR